MGQKADGLKGINGPVINQIGKIKWIRINISADNKGKKYARWANKSARIVNGLKTKWASHIGSMSVRSCHVIFFSIIISDVLFI
jgi:hypothetical protein